MGFIVWIVFLLLCIGGSVIAYLIITKDIAKMEAMHVAGTAEPRDYRKNMEEATFFKKTSQGFFGGFVGMVLISTLIASYYSIDSGEAVIFLQFGRVYDSKATAGMGFKRPWADVVEWQTRLQPMSEVIECRDNKQMVTNLDITVWWAVNPAKLADMYSRIAKDYESLREGFVLPGIRSAVRDEIGKAEFQDILVNREKYADSITKYVAGQLSEKHVIIDRVNIRNVTPPPIVNEAIDAKIKAKQKEEEMSMQLLIAKKQADIKRAEAQGIADAQTIIQQRLTPIYVQYEGIQMMKSLASSPNTTFVFAPTSMTGIGLPAVYGGPIK